MEYKYRGVELTPSIFRELLIQLFDGKQFSRQDAVDTITRFHGENGGLLTKPSYVSVFKKATQNLREDGIVNIGYGVWKLNFERSETELVVPQKQAKDVDWFADKEIGHGDSSVYLYYYDRYKEFAEYKGNNVWECKIGRTDVDPIGRIISQVGTCYPELPHIALIVKTDDSSLLEKALHNILKLKGRWLTDSPGKEWFITSPQEIENIYFSILE